MAQADTYPKGDGSGVSTNTTIGVIHMDFNISPDEGSLSGFQYVTKDLCMDFLKESSFYSNILPDGGSSYFFYGFQYLIT